MGRILAPHGVRGGIKVEPFSEAPDALLSHAKWWLRPARATDWRECRLNDGRMHAGALIAALAGVETRDDALALRGSEIGVPRAALPRAKRNEIYWADLEGLEVRNRDGKMLGVVEEVVTHGAHPIMRLTGKVGSGSGERLIPFVAAIVDRVDVDAGRIEVDWGEDY